jgi:probable HAF family extracellular repeat protein
MPVYTFNRFNNPFDRGGATTGGSGINDAADQIVGNFEGRDDGQRHGFLYSNGTYTSLTFPFPVSFNSAGGINNLGQIVGSYQDASNNNRFLYSNGAYATSLDHPSAAGGVNGGTFAEGINDAGQIVGTYQDATAHPHGFLYSNGSYTDIGVPFGINTSAHGINASGQIVGHYTAAGSFHGFFYNPNTGLYTTLDDPMATAGTQAFGINDLGQIVGTYGTFAKDPFSGGSNVVTHSFLYSDGVFNTIDDPLALSSISAHGFGGTFAHAINNHSQIVGTVTEFSGSHGFVLTITPNSPPPVATSANMVLRGANASPAVAGQYQIYNIGNNAILAAYSLGPVGTDWVFVTLGGFYDGDTSDMLLRNSTTGGFQVYDIANNNIYGSASLGAAGLDWQVMGFGNFGSFGNTDMMLRNVNTGGLQVYNISNNQITGSTFMGTVGLDWQFSGVGNFSGRGTSDMLLRNMNTGGLQVYDINSNQITGSAFIGTVGVDWRFSGVGNFSSVPGESDLLLRNSSTGGLEVYNINNNKLTGAAFIGTVGLDWEYAGVAPIRAAGASDLVLRNVNTGAFQVYNIAGNTLVGSASLGPVGVDWQLGGFAADPPSGAMASSDTSTAQLAQAMAGLGGGSGAPDGLNAGLVNADASQQPFLTTPQHA